MNLETERLILRSWTTKDVEFLYKSFNDFDVAKNLNIPFPYKKEYAKEFIEKHQKNDEDNYNFAIIQKPNNIIGGISLNFDVAAGEENARVWLAKKWWGNGYATEACSAMINLCFKNQKYKKIIAGYYQFNKASKKLHKKLGFKVINKIKDYCPVLKKNIIVVKVELNREDLKNKL